MAKFEFQMPDIEEQLRKIGEQIKNVVEGGIEHSELFPPQFIQRHSKFTSIGDLLDNSGFECETQEDWDKIDQAELDKFIDANTSFSSWEAMQSVAIEEYLKKKV